MIVPMIDQALAQARLLIGADPKQGGVRPPERAKYVDEVKRREFWRVPAREWRRLLNEALPRVGLVLVTESEVLTGGDLTVTFSLTHVGCGDTRTLTRAEPLPPAKSRSMGKQWAHTRAVNAIARTLLWQWDDEDEAADDAEEDAEKVQREDRAPRPRGQRPTRATRATNTLAGVLTGQVGEPAIELGQAEQEQEEQRAAEAEKAAEERAAAQPSAPVADPDWLGMWGSGVCEPTERADVPPLEDRLRVELERTRDQIQTREAAEDGTASPAPGSLLGAAHTDDPPMAAKPEQVESSTPAETVSAGASSNTDAPPAPGPVPPGEAGEVSSPAPEVTPPDSLGQGASTEDEPEFLCASCGEVFVEVEGEVCGLCLEASGRSDDEDDDTPEGWCGRVGDVHAICSTCGNAKAPRGRSVAAEASSGYCHPGECSGYLDAPHADQLWPGEKCAPPLCQHAGPLAAPSPEQVNVVSNVATASAQRHQGHEGTTHCPPAGLSPRHGNPERRARGAKWSARKRSTYTGKSLLPVVCAECGKDVAVGQGYFRGVDRSEDDPPGALLSRRGKPLGAAHESCVRLLEEGRDPRAEEATTA